MLRACRRGRTTRIAQPSVGVVLAVASMCLGCGEPQSGPRSLVLVVVDTLRADHLGVYGYERPTSPEIDRWAEVGVVFDRAWANSPWTLPTFGTLYTGQLPSGHGAGRLTHRSAAGAHYAAIAEETRTLAERLSSAGFATAAFVNNPFLDTGFGVARGFDHYDLSLDEGTAARRADAVTDATLRWIEARSGDRFFAVVHFMDPHAPYDPHPEVRGRFTGAYSGPMSLPVHDVVTLRAMKPPPPAADVAFIAAAYDEEILWIDRHVGRLMTRIRELGRLDETLIVLTSDHGEEIFDHGGFEHGHQLHQELLHVPLLIFGGGVRPGRVRAPVSHVDLVPTLLDALAIERSDELPGLSLWTRLTSPQTGSAGPTERSLVAEGILYGPQHDALLVWPWKLIRNRVTGESRLFDLESDPEERIDLAARDPEKLASLLARLDSPARATARTGAPVPLDARTREQLQSLGYVE